MTSASSERALVLAPMGRDAAVAASMLEEAGIEACICKSVPDLVAALPDGVGFVLVTEEALATTDLVALDRWLTDQPEWSDLPFVLLTHRGGGLERNPTAARYLEVLGNVTFLERPFHPTTLISLAQAALRGRRRQYEARARLEALHESERRFRGLADSIPTLCWMAEPDGYVFWYNRQWYDYTGTTPADMAGWGWTAVHDPEVLPLVIERWRRSIDLGVAFEMVFPLRAADGSYRSFLTRAHPLFDAAGAVTRWFGTSTDVTEQLRTEAALTALNAELTERVEQAVAARGAALMQLHEAQKLETIGQLTGGVAHDFNNLLTPITGALDLLSRRHGAADARSQRLIENAMQSAERAKTLVQRLLGFARRQTLQTVAVDVADLLENMQDLIASSVGPSIQIELSIGGGATSALADPNQLELALLNLCVNARDAMPDGGVLTISVDGVTAPAKNEIGVAPGKYVRLSVIDTGHGMDPGTLARAIEPFYSTKGVGKGTGLGLSMVHGLGAQLGGVFRLTSAVGTGTRADLYLPATARVAKVPREPSPKAFDPTPALDILLVDDEELVRGGTADMLRDLGHRVREASGGAQALALLADGPPLDLVISDYMMPHMNGAILAERIRSLRPDLPILIVTGYASGKLELQFPQLAKPFRQDDLRQAVRVVVAQKTPVATGA